MKNKEICSPVHLSVQHDTEGFHSGEETLDIWLREREFANMEASASISKHLQELHPRIYISKIDNVCILSAS